MIVRYDYNLRNHLVSSISVRFNEIVIGESGKRLNVRETVKHQRTYNFMHSVRTDVCPKLSSELLNFLNNQCFVATIINTTIFINTTYSNKTLIN